MVFLRWSGYVIEILCRYCFTHVYLFKVYCSITAKGRTNIELREQFILAQGVSQSMTGFTSKSPGGSSYSGSSQSAGSWSTRSPSSATGPITKVRIYIF